ncbi:MAG: hypothetical protein EOO39_13975 [Cytophagaceae bacterium]|nr:MAG: hypothetical protein EOO39_13975 [Cytophagaceae bacterium]
MRITGTLSYIKVETEGKIVKIEGEMAVGGFAAYANTIKRWEAPHENIIIDETTKQRLIKEIVAESEKYDYKITFD